VLFEINGIIYCHIYNKLIALFQPKYLFLIFLLGVAGQAFYLSFIKASEPRHAPVKTKFLFCEFKFIP
jgi:hypothetical protein